MEASNFQQIKNKTGFHNGSYTFLPFGEAGRGFKLFTMKYLILLLFVIIFLLFDTNLGYAYGSPFYTHLSYMFQHSGIAHLIINSIAFIGVFRMTEQFIKSWELFVLAIISAFAASFFSIYTIPTVGASSLIYAMLGIYICITLLSKRAQIINKRKYLFFLLCVAIGLWISYLKGNSNFAVHLWSLAIGFLMGSLVCLWDKR